MAVDQLRIHRTSQALAAAGNEGTQFSVQTAGRLRDDLVHGCTLQVCRTPSLALMEEMKVAIPNHP